jgi:DmsE family decaheme c-type cytochrome
MWRRTLIGLAVFTLLAANAASGASFVDSFDLPAELSYVGSAACLDCHGDIGAFYAQGPHAVERGLVVPGTGVSACEACHGPGSAHVAAGGEGQIIGSGLLAGLDTDRRLTMCTQCHAQHGTVWQDGPHAGADISCNDCHTDQAHFGGRAVAAPQFRNPSEFCLQCHAEQTSDFRLPFRHRVLENQVACVDCHDPHAGQDRDRLDGLNNICLGCHQEMSGPFVFEHDGVSGEGCTACHKPHGSNHDKLLLTEGNSLCLQCHFDAEFNSDDNWTVGNTAHAGFALGNEGRCLDCHTEIHGSNVSPTFRNQ